jgi:hypothetical protein
MLTKSVSVLVLLTVAGQAAASKPAPYQPLAKMSVNQLFGIGRRQSAGYQPTQTQCGSGATCAEACGAGFVQCASDDGETHCFDPAVQQTCCPDGTGNSCDADYYCTHDAQGNTWCCPDSLSLSQCAAAYTVTGSLVSETAAPTSSAAAASSSAPGPISSAASSYGGGGASVTTDVETDTVTTCPYAATSSAPYPSSNVTVSATIATSSPSTVVVSGAVGVAGPAAVLVIAIAALASLL